ALWKKKYPEKPAEDMWFFFDKIEWEKKTGKTSSNEFYYRIHEGIENNKAELINQAVQIITSHGKTKNQIAGSIQGVWKDDYLKLKDGSAEKVRLKDALIKAYKAIGYSASQAENTINKWKKKK
ncbi:MAG: hypothetical protein J6Y48_06555, partial [Clostridia bacterium]|nr:hypothetical protein [Clostridia bacterium]